MDKALLTKRTKETPVSDDTEKGTREVADAPPGDIYESVVRDLGFDPLRDMAARRM